MCWHCWHHIEGSRRKIKSNNRCTRSNPYVSNNHVKYVMLQECCKCGKKRITTIYRDYQVDRGLEYPSIDEDPLSIKV